MTTILEIDVAAIGCFETSSLFEILCGGIVSPLSF